MRDRNEIGQNCARVAEVGLAAEQVEASEDIDLTVETFSRWALGLCASQPDLVEQQRLIRRHLLTAGFTSDVEYFVGEIEYVLGRFPPNARDEYLRAERSGRGRAPAVPRQRREKLLAGVIAPYEEERARTGEVDWNDIALEAATAPCQGYDVVVVDEAQDLSANQIRTLNIPSF